MGELIITREVIEIYLNDWTRNYRFHHKNENPDKIIFECMDEYEGIPVEWEMLNKPSTEDDVPECETCGLPGTVDNPIEFLKDGRAIHSKCKVAEAP